MMKLILSIQIFLLLINSTMMLMLQSIPFNNKNMHPLILMSILFMLLLISSFNLSMFMNNHWFSFLMFLIIVGGMMIIFMYFISFMNNMKTSIKWNFLKNFPNKFLLIIMSSLMMLLMLKFNNWIVNFNEISSFPNLKNLNNLNNLNLMFIYPKNFTTLISMIYLFMCLTMIVKVCLMKKLTLRKIN